MKASDITDDRFLDALRTAGHKQVALQRAMRAHPWGLPTEDYHERARGSYGDSTWVSRFGIEAELAEFPPKVVLAKARRLIRRGVIGGCACGCRGDFHVIVPADEPDSDGIIDVEGHEVVPFEYVPGIGVAVEWPDEHSSFIWARMAILAEQRLAFSTERRATFSYTSS